MRLVIVSDTHSLHDGVKVPDGDVLIHAGDLTNKGDLSDVVEFNKWLGGLPHKHKIVIAGNHDFCFERKKKREAAEAALTNCVYLRDGFIVIDGVKFWGSPWQPWFYDWAFNVERGDKIAKKWAMIPEDTDVLITHGPPKGYGDKTIRGEHVGCEDLMDKIRIVRPLVHVFGHIHEDYGQWHDGVTTYINGSTCNLRYEPVNEPIVFDL